MEQVMLKLTSWLRSWLDFQQNECRWGNERLCWHNDFIHTQLPESLLPLPHNGITVHHILLHPSSQTSGECMGLYICSKFGYFAF
jgi:hypothetical protein